MFPRFIPNSGLESREKKPSLADLYKMYDYKDESLGVVEHKLDIDWSLAGPVVEKVIAKTLDGKVPDFSFAVEAVDSKDVKFESRCWISGGTLNLSFRVYTKLGDPMADFIAIRGIQGYDPVHANFWTLQHRLVKDQYRGQNIGSNVLKAIEKGVLEAAKRDGPQVLGVEARQLAVINFCLNNGFKISNEEDRKNLRDVFSGDKSKFFIGTVPTLPKEDDKKYGFIFDLQSFSGQSVGLLGIDTQQKIDSMSGSNFNFYKAHAMTINFRKDIKP